MSSVKCPQCNLTNWSTAITCKRCGGFLRSVGENTAPSTQSLSEADSVDANPKINPQIPDSANPQTQAQWAPPEQQQNYQQQNQQYQDHQQTGHQYQNYQQTNYQYYQQQQRPAANLKTGMAIASMILGILGFVTTVFLIGILIAPIGLILGIIALIKANKNPELYGGRGFAIAGVVTSAIIVLFVPIILAIAVPNLLSARRAANEASAISTLKMISNAEATYMASSYGKCGDVPTLIATRLLDVSLVSSEKNGYRFMVINLPAGGCEIHATPLSTSQGTRSFYYSTEEGIIRGGPKKGLPADKNDFPIKNDLSDRPGSRRSSASQPNEATAISSLRRIHAAETTYAATVGQGEGADLQVLALQGLIKQELADGEEDGYHFKVVKSPQKTWEAYATPDSSSPGHRSFFVGMDGVIRGGAKNGLPANANDPPVNL